MLNHKSQATFEALVFFAFPMKIYTNHYILEFKIAIFGCIVLFFDRCKMQRIKLLFKKTHTTIVRKKYFVFAIKGYIRHFSTTKRRVEKESYSLGMHYTDRNYRFLSQFRQLFHICFFLFRRIYLCSKLFRYPQSLSINRLSPFLFSLLYTHFQKQLKD